MQRKENRHHGFTLIELSIVLVIIGLVIGGALVGRDLIKSAEERALISQMEQYNTAVNTFKLKYNGLPGDLLASTAVSFGLTACQSGSAGTDGYGDNDGMLDGIEGNFFWAQLADAGLIGGNYKTASDGTYLNTATCLITNGSGSGWFDLQPKDRIGKQVIYLAGTSNIPFYYYTASGISPVQMSNIDKKIDDGKPLIGKTQAFDGMYPDEAQDCLANFTYDPAAATYSVNPSLAQTITYDLTPAVHNNPSCGAFISQYPLPSAYTETTNIDEGI